MKNIALLGSTGSIGQQGLMVCRNLRYPVTVLTARSNIKRLELQAREFLPKIVAVEDEAQYLALKTALNDLDIKVMAGRDAICEAAADKCVDFALNAIVGIAALRPTLAAIEADKEIALANKEALIAGGPLVTDAAREHGITLVPVDSEHSAIFQCLNSGKREDLRKVVLTASGGPFWGKTAGELRDVSVSDALRHPNWKMGDKITIDSATLMNKGLEVIEAMRYFDLAPEQVEVVVHRQSVMHSAVEFLDGSMIAQLGSVDMRCAIQYAVTYPRHLPTGNGYVSLTKLGALTFAEPDEETFTCLALCWKAAKMGGLAPCIVNGANEQAVELFLSEKISFLQIGELVGEALENVKCGGGFTLEAVERADRLAREYVNSRVR